jgi:hypothetical protein
MTVYKAGLILALSMGVGAITIPAPHASAQDRPAQSQDQHPQNGQKPESRPAARPQKGNTTHQQARPAQSRPAQTTRPQKSHSQPAKRPETRPQAGHTTRPTSQSNRPAQPNHAGQTNHAVRPPNNARPNRPQTRPAKGPQNRPNYQFRTQNTGRLRQYYQGRFSSINRSGRPRFSRGGYVPRTYWTYFQPLPPSLIGYIPPVPPGYVAGYYDGYIVVYDPTTFFVLSVLNLLQ